MSCFSFVLEHMQNNNLSSISCFLILVGYNLIQISYMSRFPSSAGLFLFLYMTNPSPQDFFYFFFSICPVDFLFHNNFAPLCLLHLQHKVCKFSSVVNPPFDNGTIWSISNNKFGSVYIDAPHILQV